jgi:hypothetical protein
MLKHAGGVPRPVQDQQHRCAVSIKQREDHGMDRFEKLDGQKSRPEHRKTDTTDQRCDF